MIYYLLLYFFELRTIISFEFLKLIQLKAKKAAGKDGSGPQCDAQGDYVPCQYDQSGEHWCVDTQGKEIDGTRTSPDQVLPHFQIG